MSISLISPESNPDDPFVSPNSNPEEVVVVKHGGGRPKNMVWNYFEHNALKHPGHFDAKCKFCGHWSEFNHSGAHADLCLFDHFIKNVIN
jgi:hypothetical protein